MKTILLGLLAETSIHPGAGQSSDIVDLPVAREAATDYPVVPGSSLKGALLGLAREAENAGALLVSDARLLLLPVRSLSSAYKWVTCPHLLERFSRDQQRAGTASQIETSQPASGKYLGDPGAAPGTLFLEERQFEHGGILPHGIVPVLEPLISNAGTRARLAKQLVLLHDDDFAWFARYGLAIQARNVLDPEKKTSVNLWYEETIPADAVFCVLLAERGDNAIEIVKGLFKDRPYLQVGANETVGMGWFAVAFPKMKGAAA